MEYRVSYKSSVKDLQEEINKMLSRGWKLQGGVCYANMMYYQAIFKD